MEILIITKKCLRLVGLYGIFKSCFGKLSVFVHFFGMFCSIIAIFYFCRNNTDNLFAILAAIYILVGSLSTELSYIVALFKDSVYIETFDRMQDVVNKRNFLEMNKDTIVYNKIALMSIIFRNFIKIVIKIALQYR